MGSKKVALMVNLGSPDSTAKKDVRKYLDEFLMDERVIDLAYWKRVLLIRGIILNFRPGKSAKAYRKIWWDEGSPLIVISERLQEKVANRTEFPVYLAMRYGNPSIEDVLLKIKEENPFVEEILLIPLYPHYAMSSYETVEVKVRESLKLMSHQVGLKVMPPFYNSKEYIKLLADKIANHNPDQYDQVLFSYHGIPERHVRKTDPSGGHCLKVDNCCEVPHPCQKFCYRHQTLKMTELINGELQLAEDKVASSFQSRLGNDPWLQPFTDKRLEALPDEGVKKLLIVCPAFVSDCLETLEEIEMEGQEEFLENGGEAFKMVPCLNDDDEWAELLAKWINEFEPEISLSETNTF
ncbi:ferrochelatase [Portibacter marinus]|uniref:ferrochelatase n=1 Tax=Portibacter marinus TaxID=2898660 RepID=UPI001F3051FC|nr:ferrochelatase [Portibacter marinus]